MRKEAGGGREREKERKGSKGGRERGEVTPGKHGRDDLPPSHSLGH